MQTEIDWDSLLEGIEDGTVLPVVGWGVTTYGDNDELLGPRLAVALAKKLNVDAAKLPVGFNLTDVMTRHLIDGGDREDPYKRLHRVWKDEALQPGETLRRLASVTGFKLIISMTPDTLLKRAIDQVRYDNRDVTRATQFSPKAPDGKYDTPGRLKELCQQPETNVYQILGQVAQTVDAYVLWDDDLLEFVIQLHELVKGGSLPNFSKDLADQSVEILAIGVSYSDWLMRFFLRVIRQNPLTRSEQAKTHLVRSLDAVAPDNLVMYFGRIARKISVLDAQPREFVRELAERWEQRHPQTAIEPAEPWPPLPEEMKSGAIFISYMREDEKAVRKIVSALNAAGCDVWLDLVDLKAGMNYDIRIEDYVRNRCSVFISVISDTTERTAESYALKERTWASSRMAGIAELERDRFYIPIIIDELDPGTIRHEPLAFRGVHRQKFPGGLVDNEFCKRIRLLQQEWLHRNSGK